MFHFPKNLFTDVRIETNDYVNYCTVNGEVECNNHSQTVSILIRVFDGNMWYPAASMNGIESRRRLTIWLISPKEMKKFICIRRL